MRPEISEGKRKKHEVKQFSQTRVIQASLTNRQAEGEKDRQACTK